MESRAEGSYGIYGAVKDFVQSFECLSMDCSVDNICGKFGDCMEVDSIVVFGGTVVQIKQGINVSVAFHGPLDNIVNSSLT